MYVEALALEDFRNYPKAEIAPSRELTLVVGANAQGKTNLLEAIYCLTGFGSPRGTDANLVRTGTERALLHGRVVRDERKLEVDIEIKPGRGGRALLNKTPVPGMRALSEVVTAVFFGPDDLTLVKGSPEGRRRFLDDLAVKLRPARDGIRREWERVLKQRNALLKTAPRGGRGVGTTLEVWDEALCRTGAALTAARLEVLAALRPTCRERYASISGSDALELAYESAWVAGPDRDRDAMSGDEPVADEASLQRALATAVGEVRSREIERGVSLVGPQRDDVSIWVTKQVAGETDERLDARAFASQGEQRSAALALKLAEYELLATSHGETPVLLLDDVFSELDPDRRRFLSDAVRAEGQVVMTSAEPGAAEAARAGVVLHVEGGRVEPRE